MTVTRNIGSLTGGAFSLPSNTTDSGIAFLASSPTTGTQFVAGGLSQIARYQGTAITGNGAGDSVVTFLNIPQTYKHLLIKGVICPGSNTTGNGNDYASLRLNNDSTTSNYAYWYESSTNTTAASHSHTYSTQTTSTSAQLFPVYYNGYNPSFSGGNYFDLWIPYYSRTENYLMKSWHGFSHGYQNGITRFTGMKNNQSASTDKAPVTRIDFGLFGTLRMCRDTDIILYGVS